MPNGWKRIIHQTNSNKDALAVKNHHVTKRSRIITVNKLYSRELALLHYKCRTSANISFDNLFLNEELICTNIYILPRNVTINSYLKASSICNYATPTTLSPFRRGILLFAHVPVHAQESRGHKTNFWVDIFTTLLPVFDQ